MPVQQKDTLIRFRIILFLSGAALIILDFLMDALNPFADQSFGKIQLIILLIGLVISLLSFVPKTWLECILSKILNVWDWAITRINVLLAWIYRHFGLEIIAILSISWLYFRNVFQFNEPVGYAGLYVLSTNLLIENHFRIPTWVPFYGPGGIPFSYPPVGFYLAGLAQQFLGIPINTYLRFAPALWTLFALAATYLLARRITGNSIKAVLAVFFVGVSYEIYNTHATAAGMVRAPALLWMVLTLIGLWMVLIEGKKSIIVLFLTSVGIALTAMTHLAYLTFIVLTVIFFLFSQIDKNFFQRIMRLGIISVIAAALSAPWWVTIISRYGTRVFIQAFSTHDTLNNFGKLLSGQGEQVLTGLFTSWGGMPLYGFILLGMIFSFWKRSYLLPVWCLGTYLLIGESDRFQVMIGGLIVADMIVDWAIPQKAQTHQKRSDHILQYVLPGILLVLVIWSQVFVKISSMQPSLNSSLESAAEWIQTNTEPNSKILFFSMDHDTGEWLPYLTQRNPAVGHWGAEWLGTMEKRYLDWNLVNDCALQESLNCLKELVQEKNISFNYVFVSKEASLLNESFAQAMEYSMVYKNDKFLIYEKKSQ